MLDFSKYQSIPIHTQHQLNAYVNRKLYPSRFLTAVLSNKLFDAVYAADSENLLALNEIVNFIYNHIPATAWGSEERVYQWCEPTFYENLIRNAEGAVDEDLDGC